MVLQINMDMEEEMVDEKKKTHYTLPGVLLSLLLPWKGEEWAKPKMKKWSESK